VVGSIVIAMFLPLIAFKGYELVQICLNVALHRRVRALIDRYAGGRMRHEKVADAVGYACFLDRLLDLFRNVDKLCSCLALYVYIPYHRAPLLVNNRYANTLSKKG